MMTLIPMVSEYNMVVSEYLESKYSDFIMVSANVLGSEDMMSTSVTLNPMVSVDNMVMCKYLVTKYLIMLYKLPQRANLSQKVAKSISWRLRGNCLCLGCVITTPSCVKSEVR